jgi:hypothetical protein
MGEKDMKWFTYQNGLYKCPKDLNTNLQLSDFPSFLDTPKNHICALRSKGSHGASMAKTIISRVNMASSTRKEMCAVVGHQHDSSHAKGDWAGSTGAAGSPISQIDGVVAVEGTFLLQAGIRHCQLISQAIPI